MTTLTTDSESSQPIPRASPVAVVIADDLTGACDSGVEFAGRGLLTRVGLGTVPCASADVVVVSTNSRDMEGSAAASHVAAIAGSMARDIPILFRKIDSTLRGNIVSECDALLETLGLPYGVVAPSLPRQGRTLTGGILRIRDIAGTRSLNAAQLIAEQGGAVAALPIHCNPAYLRDAIEEAAQRGARYILCDAARDADLHNIALAIRLCRPRPMWIGSAGLASRAADLLSHRSDSFAARRPLWRDTRSAALVCVGSNHPVTTLQVSHLCRSIRIAVLDAAESQAGELREALSRSGMALLSLGATAVTDEQVRELFRAAVDSGVGRILMSGGETAELLCRAAGADHLLLTGEVVPGVAEGIVQGGLLDGLILATKSGGFGLEDCLTGMLCTQPGTAKDPS